MSETHGLKLRERAGIDTESEGDIDEREIHDILRNWRRRMVIKELKSSAGSMTLRELAETLAESESGESPPPRNVRNSVYNSLHQTHLPKLDDAGVVSYDTDRKTVSLESQARDVDLYMEVVTQYGITWATFYRRLMTLALLTLLGAEVGVPLLSSTPSLLLHGAFLATVAASSLYHLWSERWRFFGTLRD